MTNAVAPTRAGQVRPKLDQICAEAVDIARDAVTEDVAGPYIEAIAEGERLVTHYFECTMTGYRGWRWAVTVARTSRSKQVTICETVLLPGPDALTTPDWVPWNERVQPGDLGVGDLMPTAADDDRLVPGYVLSEDPAVDDVVWELGLGRVRVMSREGRIDAAERWYEGDHGPQAPIAVAAPANARCVSCGFFLPLAGSMSALFGACANLYAPDDGRVVSGDHGCGAHSEVLVEQTVEVDEAPTIYDDAEVEPVAVQVGPADVAAVELDTVVAGDISTLVETDVSAEAGALVVEDVEPAAEISELVAAADDVEALIVEEPLAPAETLAVDELAPVAEAFAPVESDVEAPQVGEIEAIADAPQVSDVEPVAEAYVPAESVQIANVIEPTAEVFAQAESVQVADEVQPVKSDDVETPEIADEHVAVVDDAEAVVEVLAPAPDDIEAIVVEEPSALTEASVFEDAEPVAEVLAPVESDGESLQFEETDTAGDAPQVDDVEPAADESVPVEPDAAEAFAPAEGDVEVGIVEEQYEPVTEALIDSDDDAITEMVEVDDAADVIGDATQADAEPESIAETPVDPTVDELEAVVETFAPADEIEPASADLGDFAVEPASFADEPAAPSDFDLGSEIPVSDAGDASETRAATATFEQLAAAEPQVEQVEPEYPADEDAAPPAFDLGSDVSADEHPQNH